MSPFLLKCLERLVLWELESTALESNPLSRFQHAFRRDRGTDTALSEVVDKIESGLLRGQYTLGVFLDIQGAFDNLSIKSAIIGMKDRGFPPLITSWYRHYLSNRCAEIEVKGTKVKRSLSKGVPQGGVISPLCWNITFDNML
jgi:hypothetical protein